MTQMPEPAGDNGPQRLEPMRLSRVFAARRETVFAAWSTTDHVRRWFCPETFSIPDASVEMRVGGRFDLCMRSPAGEEHWVHGRFTEVLPHRRLAIEMQITDGAGTPLFKTLTEVDFSDATGTRMDVVQTYTMIDPAKTWMVAGAPEGWRSTLDKLEREVARIEGAGKPA